MRKTVNNNISVCAEFFFHSMYIVINNGIVQFRKVFIGWLDTILL